MQTILNNFQMFLNSDIKTFILSIIWFFSISLLLAYYLKKNQSQTYILSFVVSGLVLYIGGLFKHISIAYYACWILIGLVLIWLLIKRKGNELLDNIDLFGSISFIVVLLILFIIYQEVAFRYTDEFMHWGPMVREMVNIDGFYCEPSSSLMIHRDYPPFFSLIELLFCLFKGKYIEKYLYIALISFVYSTILAVISNAKKTSLFKVFDILAFTLVGLLFQHLPSAKDSIGLYNSVYIDYVLAFYVFYLIYRLIKEKGQISNIELSILLSGLILTKQISILFLFICVVLLFFYNRTNVKRVLWSVLLPVIFYVSWKSIISINNIVGQFSLSNFSARTDIVNIFINYVKGLVVKPLFDHPFKLSFVLCSLILMLLIIVLRKHNKISTKEVILLVISLFLYVLVIDLMYCFVFSIEEAYALASFERYLLTYIFIYILIILAFAIENSNLLTYIIVFGSLLLFADFNNSYLYKITNSKDVLVVRQWGEEFSLDEPKNNGSHINLVRREYIDETVDHEDLLKEISNYNYIYIFKYDDIFYQHWKQYTNGALLEDDSLYYINKENNKINFVDDKYSSIYYEILYYLHITE